MSLKTYIKNKLKFHTHDLEGDLALMHADFLGDCYSTIYVTDGDDMEFVVELAMEDIVDKIIGDLVGSLSDIEELSIIDPETNDMRLITLTREEDDSIMVEDDSLDFAVL